MAFEPTRVLVGAPDISRMLTGGSRFHGWMDNTPFPISAIFCGRRFRCSSGYEPEVAALIAIVNLIELSR